jgi:hypothetical protein
VRGANWSHFERLALAASLAEPAVLPKVSVLAWWAKERRLRIDRRLWQRALATLIAEAAQRGQASEVAWGLWTAIALGISLSWDVTRAVSIMADDVVALVALHAKALGLMKGLDATLWQSWMSDDQLRNEHWLMAYEAYEHGWLPSVSGTDYIASDPTFAPLRAANVRFYDETAQMPPPPARPPVTTPPPTVRAISASIALAGLAAGEAYEDEEAYVRY